jgi:hypothetical protein
MCIRDRCKKGFLREGFMMNKEEFKKNFKTGDITRSQDWPEYKTATITGMFNENIQIRINGMDFISHYEHDWESGKVKR